MGHDEAGKRGKIDDDGSSAAVSGDCQSEERMVLKKVCRGPPFDFPHCGEKPAGF